MHEPEGGEGEEEDPKDDADPANCLGNGGDGVGTYAGRCNIYWGEFCFLDELCQAVGKALDSIRTHAGWTDWNETTDDGLSWWKATVHKTPARKG